jgi:hypothetical protein
VVEGTPLLREQWVKPLASSNLALSAIVLITQGGVMFKKLGALLLAAGVLMSVGCNNQNQIIEKVTYTPSDDLKTIKVSLVFKSNVQSTMAGGISTDYGYFFVNPYTGNQPFEIGFDLNMNVFYDQQYVGLTPTMTLPNGLPTGIPWPVVEVKSPTPVHPDFDVYGYVDVGHLSWLGSAVMFSFLDNQNFPVDLSVSQVFYRDNEGKPGVLASVFGPTLKPDGTLLRHGGIAVFANVRQLIQNHGHKQITMYPKEFVKVEGPDADKYQSPRALKKLQDRFLRLINQN